MCNFFLISLSWHAWVSAVCTGPGLCFQTVFIPQGFFLSLVLRSRQAAHKTNLLDNQFDFILTDLSLDHARLIIRVFDV